MPVMARLRTHRSLALLTIALVTFAAFVPSIAASLPVVVLVPLWAILPTVVAVTLLRRQLAGSCEQVASLLSFVVSRAPPASA